MSRRLTDLDDVEQLIRVGVLEGVAGLKVLGEAHEARDVQGDAHRDVVHVQRRAGRQLRHVSDDLGQCLDDVWEAVPAMQSSSDGYQSGRHMCAGLHMDAIKCLIIGPGRQWQVPCKGLQDGSRSFMQQESQEIRFIIDAVIACACSLTGG